MASDVLKGNLRPKQYLPAPLSTAAAEPVAQVNVLKPEGKEMLVEAPAALETIPAHQQTGPSGLLYLSRLIMVEIETPVIPIDGVMGEEPVQQ